MEKISALYTCTHRRRESNARDSWIHFATMGGVRQEWKAHYRPEAVARTAMACLQIQGDAIDDATIIRVGEGVLRAMNRRLAEEGNSLTLPPKYFRWGRQTFIAPVRTSINALRAHWPTGCDWFAAATCLFGDLPGSDDASDGEARARSAPPAPVLPVAFAGRSPPRTLGKAGTHIGALTGSPRTDSDVDEEARDARTCARAVCKNLARPTRTNAVRTRLT